ncbi:MAG TPA: hypothetical protein VIL55_02325 [Naasia sp.]
MRSTAASPPRCSGIGRAAAVTTVVRVDAPTSEVVVAADGRQVVVEHRSLPSRVRARTVRRSASASASASRVVVASARGTLPFAPPGAERLHAHLRTARRVLPFGPATTRGQRTIAPVTTYAYDPATTSLIATWSSGIGAVARPVARLHARTPVRSGMHLAQALTDLSSTSWLCYSDPGLVDLDPGPALRALRRPHLPEGNLLYQEADDVLDAAHHAGRAVAAVGSAGVLRAVLADVDAEFDAVRRALDGDLTGRARQAAVLNRLDVHPAQVALADRHLYDVPMGNEALFDEVDPTAASVAAAHWLRAAVDATLPDGDPVPALRPAATAEGVSLAAAAVVLGAMAEGVAPLIVVQDLVRAARMAARGWMLSGPADEPQVTLLDPERPSRALLSGLTRAIQVCFLTHVERCDPTEVDGDGEWPDLVRDRFDDLVRAEARRCADRLVAGAADPQAPG